MSTVDPIDENLSQWREVARVARESEPAADGDSDTFSSFRWTPSDPDEAEGRAAEIETSLGRPV